MPNDASFTARNNEGDDTFNDFEADGDNNRGTVPDVNAATTVEPRSTSMDTKRTMIEFMLCYV